MFRSISQWILNGTTTNHHKPWHGPLQMMTWIIANHYKSPQVYHDMNHHKSQITTNHHKPWHKPPWTMTETSTKHDMNHYKSPQTMTWTIMMTQKELCIKPYGFLVRWFKCSSGLDKLWLATWDTSFWTFLVKFKTYPRTYSGPFWNISILTTPGLFEYFSENGCCQKIKVFLMKDWSLLLLSV